MKLVFINEISQAIAVIYDRTVSGMEKPLWIACACRKKVAANFPVARRKKYFGQIFAGEVFFMHFLKAEQMPINTVSVFTFDYALHMFSHRFPEIVACWLICEGYGFSRDRPHGLGTAVKKLFCHSGFICIADFAECFHLSKLKCYLYKAVGACL